MLSKRESEESKPLSFIFSMTAFAANSLLTKCNIRGTWLLRESSKAGCLSISYLKYDTGEVLHNRFGFLGGKWIFLNHEKYEKYIDRIDMDKINCEASVIQLINNLKSIGPVLNGEAGFDIHSPLFFRPLEAIECAVGYRSYDSSYVLMDEDETLKPSGTGYRLFSSSDGESDEEMLPDVESPFTVKG